MSGESSAVEALLLENFSKEVANKGFLVEDVTVGVPEVDEETQKSIDSIIQAGQENEKAKLEAETAKTKADSESYVTKTKAQAEADANAIKLQKITPELIEYMNAEARLKHGWVEVLTNGDAIVDASKK